MGAAAVVADAEADFFFFGTQLGRNDGGAGVANNVGETFLVEEDEIDTSTGSDPVQPIFRENGKVML